VLAEIEHGCTTVGVAAQSAAAIRQFVTADVLSWPPILRRPRIAGGHPEWHGEVNTAFSMVGIFGPLA